MDKTFRYFFIFAFGALVGGGVIWKLQNITLERTLELTTITSEAATLERDIKLLGLDDELRCKLSKITALTAAQHERTVQDIGESPLLGSPGLASFTEEFLNKVLVEYRQSNIQDYSANCVSDTRLY